MSTIWRDTGSVLLTRGRQGDDDVSSIVVTDWTPECQLLFDESALINRVVESFIV